MQGVPVGFGVDGDRGDAQAIAGANHPAGDFATVGDEDFIEKRHFYFKSL
nr:F235 [uncultured bacterium]